MKNKNRVRRDFSMRWKDAGSPNGVYRSRHYFQHYRRLRRQHRPPIEPSRGLLAYNKGYHPWPRWDGTLLDEGFAFRYPTGAKYSLYGRNQIRRHQEPFAHFAIFPWRPECDRYWGVLAAKQELGSIIDPV